MANEVTILDGGMGRELKRMGAPFRNPEWSALALMQGADFIAQAHANFIEAGAQVVTTNAYAVVPHTLGPDLFADKGAYLAELAAHLAKAAANEADSDVKVAACLPPLFGSYEPQNFDQHTAPGYWSTLIKAQDEHCDIWLQETISSLAEFTTCFDTVKRFQDFARPYWASFSIADQLVDGKAVLRTGETMSQVARSVSGKVDAVLVNCSQPEVTTLAVEALAKRFAGTSTQVGAYANAFSNAEPDDAQGFTPMRQDLTPTGYRNYANSWIGLGATIIGGCCGIGPEHIAAIDELVKR